MISVTFASIMTLLAILNTNKAGNVVVSMILALVLLVSGSFIHQKLGEPKLYDNYVTVNEMGIPTQVEQLPNPQYIEGTPRIVLEVLSDLLPSGQAIQLADAFDTEGMTDESIANEQFFFRQKIFVHRCRADICSVCHFLQADSFDSVLREQSESRFDQLIFPSVSFTLVTFNVSWHLSTPVLLHCSHS